MMMNAKKHSGKRKSYIPSDRPRNNADRVALKYAKTPSMYGYIKFPIGRPTKTIDSQTVGPSPSTADTALAPTTAAAASRASSVKVNMSSKTRGLYNKHDDRSGQDAWVTSMLLNNNRKIANEAMFKADPQAVVPLQTLNSLLNSTKAKINAITSGDYGTDEYDIDQRPSQDSDTSSFTMNSDRELLQHIAKYSGMSRKEMIVLITKLFGAPYKTAENHFDYLIKSKQLNELKRGGCVVAAQATTTNSTAITTQKLLRTHNTTLLAFSKQVEWKTGWDNRTCEQIWARILVRTLSGRQRKKKSSRSSRTVSRLILMYLASWEVREIYM